MPCGLGWGLAWGLLLTVVLGDRHKGVVRGFPSPFCLGKLLATFGDIFGCHDLGGAHGDWDAAKHLAVPRTAPLQRTSQPQEPYCVLLDMLGSCRCKKVGGGPDAMTCHNSPCS